MKENEEYNYKSNYQKGENVIIFIEEIIFDLLNDKNPIIILKRTDSNISGNYNKLEKGKIIKLLLKK